MCFCYRCCSVMSNSLQPPGLHAVHQASLSFTISQSLLKLMSIELVIQPTILSSVVPFSSCLQSFPASVSFLTSQLFTLSGQSVGASASALVLLMNIQGWFPLGLTGLISLLSRLFSSTTIWKHQFFGCLTFFMVQLSHPNMTTGKTIALTIQFP